MIEFDGAFYGTQPYRAPARPARPTWNVGGTSTRAPGRYQQVNFASDPSLFATFAYDFDDQVDFDWPGQVYTVTAAFDGALWAFSRYRDDDRALRIGSRPARKQHRRSANAISRRMGRAARRRARNIEAARVARVMRPRQRTALSYLGTDLVVATTPPVPTDLAVVARPRLSSFRRSTTRTPLNWWLRLRVHTALPRAAIVATSVSFQPMSASTGRRVPMN